MKCSFCSNEIPRGTGMTYVQNDARIFYFCSSKCQKGQLKLRHKGWEVKWTETYRKAKSVSAATAAASKEKNKEQKQEQKQKPAPKKEKDTKHGSDQDKQPQAKQ